MAIQFQDPLGEVPLRNAKAELKASEAPRRNLTCRGWLIDQARKRCDLEVKQMADQMGVSESFLLRGFKDQEHISWHRLQKLSPAFHRELLALQASELDGVEVVTQISIRRIA